MTTLFYREWRVLALAIGLILATGAASLLTIGRQELILRDFRAIWCVWEATEAAREAVSEGLRKMAKALCSRQSTPSRFSSSLAFMSLLAA
jgi:hypothetical protein